jgi:phage terminase large subunit-like protein
MPRVMAVPEASSSLGGEAVDLARSAGLQLDAWQAFVLERALGCDADGHWTALEVAVNVPRQNGKGAILEARELAGLFLIEEGLITHTAHQADTSMEAFRRLLTLIEETPELDQRVKKVSYRNGHEGIELFGGSRIRFRTRTRGGGRGFSGDLVVYDEAMFLAEFSHAALLPTVSARPNPQLWYAGSAVDQEIHEHGLVFARLRARALKGNDPSLAYFEWSFGLDNPVELDEAAALSVDAWQIANPALGIRIRPEYIESEFRALDTRSFAVERLGVGDWPDPDAVADSPIPYEAWAALEQPNSKIVGSLCLAFDISPDRRASIAAAGRNHDGRWHVEVIQNRQGTGWLPDRLTELVGRHDVTEVVCDGYGPAGSIIGQIEEAGIKVEQLTSTQHGQACGRLVDQVAQESIRHLGQGELSSAIRGAKPRPLGDAWAWSRKSSTVDISPLVAATLALSAAMDNPYGWEPQVF